jgi:L-amino acid N-acyltransferase YncA
MIRLCHPDDGAALAAIYRPHVEGSPTSFETVAPDAHEMTSRIEAGVSAGFPWLVATEDDRVLGYAYASLHRTRAAYQWSAETSVYLSHEAAGRGLGTLLMTALLSLLEAQGYGVVLAGVTLPNDASVRLHTRLGYAPVGVFRELGFKDGAWHDVWWSEKRLKGCLAPQSPLPLQALPATAWPEAGVTPPQETPA